jgi:hypothetical protein
MMWTGFIWLTIGLYLEYVRETLGTVKGEELLE